MCFYSFLKCGNGLKLNLSAGSVFVVFGWRSLKNSSNTTIRGVVPREISVVQQPSNGFFRRRTQKRRSFRGWSRVSSPRVIVNFAVLGIRTYQLRYQLSAVRALCFLTRIPLDNQIAFNNGWPTFFLFHVHPRDAILANHIPESPIPATPTVIQIFKNVCIVHTRILKKIFSKYIFASVTVYTCIYNW